MNYGVIPAPIKTCPSKSQHESFQNSALGLGYELIAETSSALLFNFNLNSLPWLRQRSIMMMNMMKIRFMTMMILIYWWWWWQIVHTFDYFSPTPEPFNSQKKEFAIYRGWRCIKAWQYINILFRCIKWQATMIYLKRKCFMGHKKSTGVLCTITRL